MLSFSVLLLMISGCVVIADDVTDGTELVMSFLIHRHGDRTPIASSSLLSTDPDALEALSAPYGYGQLTPAGKRRGYELGQYIRERYNELLAPTYNKSEVYIRSTDSTRAKMTVLAALAAIYPPTGDKWNDELPWEPVPYTTLPAKYDFNLFSVNCPTFMTGMLAAYTDPVPAFTAKYSGVLTTLSSVLGFDLTNLPPLVYTVYDVFTSQISLGIDLGEELDAIFDEIAEAAGVSMGLLFGIEEYIPLQAGVLLQEFYEYSKQAIAGEDTQRLRIYSAHDTNVYSFEAVTKVNRQGVPKYATAYSLEVRKVISTGAYVVLPVYKSPGEEVKYLQVEGCEQLCEYDQFIQLTEKYSLDVETWRDQCGWTEDLVVDDSSVA